CNVTPGLPEPEGPSGITCNDGIDNDCDGFTDNGDAGCNSAALMARCALLPVTGLGRDKSPHVDRCTSWHQVDFEILGAGPGATITTELQAINPDGVTLGAATIQDGDFIELAALNLSESCIIRQTGNNRHRVYAPVAMVKITVADGNNTAYAFCTNIPYLDVVEPSGQVVSASEGDITPVVAAIPQVDPASLFVKVDGVDLLAELGINPATQFPGGPFSGNVLINNNLVHVSDLFVRQGVLGVLSSNTISMKLEGLGGGGHIVVVDGEPHPTALPAGWPVSCYHDDVRDIGTSSGLEIILASPMAGQVTNVVPTPVIGKVLSGKPINHLAINGMKVDTSGQIFTMGDGENSVDNFCLNFNELIGQTDILFDINTGNHPLGSFDRGSNRVVVDTLDDTSSRSFATRLFATGSVGKDVDNLPNAIVVGLSADAIRQLFEERSAEVGQQFLDTVRSKIQEQNGCDNCVTVEFDCCCNVHADVRPISPYATGNPNQLSIDVTLLDDRIRVRINLPDLTTYLAVDGHCEESGIFGECAERSDVHSDVITSTTGMWLEFDITENMIKGLEQPGEPTFSKGTSMADTDDRGSGTSCWVCDLCEFASAFAGFLLDLLTLGFLPNEDNPFYDFLIPSVESSATDQAVQDAVGSSEPDPIGLGEIVVAPEAIQGFMVTLMAGLNVVDISPLGLRASLDATFTTIQTDPTIPPTPGAVLSPAPAPGFPDQVPGSDDAYVGIADDVINQLFASLTASGLLKANCQNTGKTLNDFLNQPADCETIMGGTDNETAAQQGRCHAFKGADCAMIPVQVGMGLGILERTTCTVVKALNLRENTTVLVCAQQEVPPQLLITDDINTAPVETSVRLNDLSIAMVADRDNNGLEGELLALRGCFQQGAPTLGDCNLFAACVDLNILTEMQFQTCADGVPGIVTTPTGIATTIRQLGVVCGAASATDDMALTDAAGEGQQIMDIIHDLEDFTPPLCAQGLTLGDFVNFVNPRLISIETDGDPAMQDYLGITGRIDP
ncbi:MAG: hypothetical protein AABZ47_14385, partial [Planctomycetota bacterium]